MRRLAPAAHFFTLAVSVPRQNSMISCSCSDCVRLHQPAVAHTLHCTHSSGLGSQIMAAERAPQPRVAPNAFADPPLLDGLVDAPVLPFSEAVQRTGIEISDDCVAKAAAHHRNMSPPDAHGLTPDEIAAFHLYTQDSPFFFELNKSLRDMDRPRVANCLPYLRLLVSGMNKLPKLRGRVFRAITVNFMDTLEPEKRHLPIAEAFPDGHEFLWWGVTTTYTGRKLIPLFAGYVGRRTIFTINTHSAVLAAPYSAAGDKEKEWTLAPGARFRVVNGANSTFEQGDDAELELEEIGTPFSLAQFVGSSQALVPSARVGSVADFCQPMGIPIASPLAHASSSRMCAEIRRHLMFLHSVPLVVRAGNSAIKPVTQLDTAGEARLVLCICRC